MFSSFRMLSAQHEIIFSHSQASVGLSVIGSPRVEACCKQDMRSYIVRAKMLPYLLSQALWPL